MPAQFVALPVGQGDAFFLERTGLRVLVDGGKSRKQSVQYLMPLLLDAPYLDVVICTHNDKDHAEGVRALLESETIAVGEVWLPGRWTDRLVELCRADREFYRELMKQVADAPKGGSLENDLADEAERQARASTDGDTHATDDQELLDAIDHAESGPHFPPRWRYWDGPLSDEQEALWADCINAAERIRAIAVAARNLGAHIRWFDYGEFEKGGSPAGGRGDLQPINSVEITRRVTRPVPSALRFLSLSVANRESLVFRSLPHDEAPGVLFTADSDLAFNAEALRVQDNEIVTSPHHGSEANANAYKVVDHLAGSNAQTITWVRSDGRFQSRPGNAFLNKRAQAACTRCKGHTTPGQAITLTGASGAWTINSSKCGCGV